MLDLKLAANGSTSLIDAAGEDISNGLIAHTLNNELILYGDLEYDDDANGNMIEQRSATQSWRYVYNAANRLIRVEETLSGTVIAEYGCDPLDGGCGKRWMENELTSCMPMKD